MRTVGWEMDETCAMNYIVAPDDDGDAVSGDEGSSDVEGTTEYIDYEASGVDG